LARISNGSVTLPLYVRRDSTKQVEGRYSGNETLMDCILAIHNTAGPIDVNITNFDSMITLHMWNSIAFKNGGYTAVWGITGDNNDNSNDPNNPDDLGGGSTLTVTGIPSKYNGKYVYFNALLEVGVGICSAQSITDNPNGAHLAQISNGSVTQSFIAWNDSVMNYERYTGNETLLACTLTIYSSNSTKGSGVLATVDWLSITFSNGGYTTTWSNADYITEY